MDTGVIYLLEDQWAVLKDLLRAEAGVQMLGREEEDRIQRVGVSDGNVESEPGLVSSATANVDAEGAKSHIHMRCEAALRVRSLKQSVLERQVAVLKPKLAQLQRR